VTNLPEFIKDADTSKQSKEPALSVGATGGTVAGTLALLLYLFPEIPEGTLRLVFVISAFALPVVTAILTRGRVWSPASVVKLVDEAVAKATEVTKMLSERKPTIEDK
jgi:hypothetical protein